MNRPQRREVGRALAFLQKGDTHPTLVCLRRLASHERWLGARLRLAREVRRAQLVLPLPPVPWIPRRPWVLRRGAGYAGASERRQGLPKAPGMFPP